MCLKLMDWNIQKYWYASLTDPRTETERPSSQNEIIPSKTLLNSQLHHSVQIKDKISNFIHQLLSKGSARNTVN